MILIKLFLSKGLLSPLMMIICLDILVLTKIMLILIKLFPSKGLLPLAAVIVFTHLGHQLTITAPHERCAYDKDQLFISHASSSTLYPCERVSGQSFELA